MYLTWVGVSDRMPLDDSQPVQRSEVTDVGADVAPIGGLEARGSLRVS